VGQPGLSHLLIDATDRKRDVDGHNWRLMSLNHQHLQPIGKCVFEHEIG
jgi:hypothetical protein